MSISERMRAMRELPHLNRHLGTSPHSSNAGPAKTRSMPQESGPSTAAASVNGKPMQARPAYRMEVSAPAQPYLHTTQTSISPTTMYTPSSSSMAQELVGAEPSVYRRVARPSLILLDYDSRVQKATVAAGTWIVTGARVIQGQLAVFHVDSDGQMHRLVLLVPEGAPLADYFDQHTLLLSDTVSSEM